MTNLAVPEEDLDGGWVIGVAGIIELGAVGDDHEGIHLGAEFDVLAGIGDAVFEGEFAGEGDRYVHEEVDVGGEIGLGERVDCAGGPVEGAEEEALSAGVHEVFVEGVADLVALAGAGSAEGVVAAAGVCGDGEEGVAKRGDEAGAGGEINVALGADSVLGAVAVGIVVRVAKQGVDGLVAFEVDDADVLALADLVEEKVSGGNGVGEDSVHGLAGAGGEGFGHGLSGDD